MRKGKGITGSLNRIGFIMEKKRKYYISMIVMVLLIAVTFIFLLKDSSPQALFDVIQSVNPWFVLIGLTMMFLFISCEAFNIRNIMRSLDRKIPFIRCLKYAFVGFYFSSVTPSSTGGQPMQVYYMKKDKIEVGPSSLTLMIIMAVFQTTTLFYGAVSFLLKGQLVIEHVQALGFLVLYGTIVNIGLVTGICVMVFSDKIVYRLVMWCARMLKKIHLVKDSEKLEKSLEEQIHEYKKGAKHLRKHPKVLIKVFATVAVQLIASYSVPYFVYKAFGLSEYSFLDIVAVQALLTIAVSSLPLPGAVGVSESGFMLIFRIFFSSQLLLPAMLLSRGISFYFYVVVSGIVSVAAYLHSSRRNHRELLGKIRHHNRKD